MSKPAYEVTLPTGTISLDDAVELLSRHKNSGSAEANHQDKKDVWRRLCGLVIKGRVRPVILTGNRSYLADPAQFVALADRYIFVARSIVGRLPGEDRDVEVEIPNPLSEWRDIHGYPRHHSKLVFLERELEAPNRRKSNPSLKRGRKPSVDWTKVKDRVFGLMNRHGDFASDKPYWNRQAKLERSIAEFITRKLKVEVPPSESTIRGHVAVFLREWRSEQNVAVTSAEGEKAENSRSLELRAIQGSAETQAIPAICIKAGK